MAGRPTHTGDPLVFVHRVNTGNERYGLDGGRHLHKKHGFSKTMTWLGPQSEVTTGYATATIILVDARPTLRTTNSSNEYTF